MRIPLSIIFFASIIIVGCKNQKGPGNFGAKPFPVVEVETRTVIGYESYPAAIEGINNNEIRAKISGYIKEVFVDEGAYVNKGQILFRLETNTLTQNVQASKSSVDAALSSINAAQSTVDAAQVEVDKLKPLVEKKIISNVQLETAQANLLRAKSQLDQAKAGYHQALANYKAAQANEDYAIIRAPISGVVGKINFREGSLVGPGDPTPITVISDTKELYAYFSMNEADYLNFLAKTPGNSLQEKIQQFPLVDLELANGERYGIKGKLGTVTGQVNPQTGTVQFRVSFSNENGLLTNGNSGVVRIPKQYNDAIVLPESSTFEQQGITYAYKIEADTAKLTIIDVCDRIDNLVLVKSGLKKGDIVAANGVGNIKNNTPIKPVRTTIDSIVQKIKPIF